MRNNGQLNILYVVIRGRSMCETKACVLKTQTSMHSYQMILLSTRTLLPIRTSPTLYFLTQLNLTPLHFCNWYYPDTILIQIFIFLAIIFSFSS